MSRLAHRGRIGVVDLAMNGWMAGGVVARTMALALKGAGADVVFLTRHPGSLPGVDCLEPPVVRHFPGEWALRKLSGRHKPTMDEAWLRAQGVGVVLPVVESWNWRAVRQIGWIPDLQHVHLPALYSDSDRALLDQRFARLAESSDRMLFSSADCQLDFERYLPRFANKARMASFPSIFVFEPPPADLPDVRAKFHLPERFVVVVNQFWRHKNHEIVPQALSLLRQRGMALTVVMAGLPVDFRDKQNGPISDTLQAAAGGGVWSQCVVLGKIERSDLIALLRTAALIVQPSRFEGWNTTVQDAKALGCPLLVSDLAVHREQCPEALGYFSPDDPAALAALLERVWPGLPARPVSPSEFAVVETEKRFAADYGQRLRQICAELQ